MSENEKRKAWVHFGGCPLELLLLSLAVAIVILKLGADGRLIKKKNDTTHPPSVHTLSATATPAIIATRAAATAQADAATQVVRSGTQVVMDTTAQARGYARLDGQNITRLGILARYENVNFYACNFGPDPMFLVCNSGNSQATIVNSLTGGIERSLSHHYVLGDAVFSPIDMTIATGECDFLNTGNGVYLWDTRTGQQLRRMDGETEPVGKLAFSVDGRLLAAGSYLSKDRTIRIWEVASGKLITVLKAPIEVSISGLVFDPTGHYLASTGSDNTVRIWDLQTQSEVQHFSMSTSWVWALQWSNDGSMLAAGGDDGNVRLWETKTWTLLHTLQINWIVWDLAFSPDSIFLAAPNCIVSDMANSSQCLIGTVWIWDTRTGERVSSTGQHQGEIRSVDWSFDGTTLVALGSQLLELYGIPQ